MKFANKKNQDILEVLHYDDGPCVYGFEQSGESFLACLQETKSDNSQRWLIFSLQTEDLGDYEKIKNQKMSLTDFVKNKPAWEVTYDYEGLCLQEKLLTGDLSKASKSYVLAS